MNKAVRVSETFDTLQGTGALTGVRQFFVRFSGCAVHDCPIRAVCDEQGSLDFGGTEIGAEQLADNALATVGINGWVHITGGEPCDQPVALKELAMECTRRKLRIHLQTSGARRVPIEWDWLTISPKLGATKLLQSRCTELVVVYDPAVIIDVGVLRGYHQFTKALHYYLVPLWTGDAHNGKATADMVLKCNRAGMSWRLAIQAHKFWGIE